MNNNENLAATVEEEEQQQSSRVSVIARTAFRVGLVAGLSLEAISAYHMVEHEYDRRHSDDAPEAAAPPQDQSLVPTVTTKATNGLTMGSVPEVVRTPEILSFQAFRSKEQVRPSLLNEAKSAVLRVQTPTVSCTGTLVDGWFVTAGHCGEDNPSTIRLFPWKSTRDGTDLEGELSKWISSPADPDLLVGIPTEKNGHIGGWETSGYANGAPDPGSRFVMASLPGKRTEPIAGNLTYLELTDKQEWLFVIDPETTNTVNAHLCSPGASGSLMTNGSAHYAVLTGVITKFDSKGVQNPAWISTAQSLKDRAHVDVSEAGDFCFGTPLLGERFRQYTDKLEQ